MTTKRETAVDKINRELGSFVSLAANPTMLPTFAGLVKGKVR